MKSADNDGRVCSVYIAEGIQNVEDAVVGAAGNQDVFILVVSDHQIYLVGKKYPGRIRCFSAGVIVCFL